MTLAEAVWISFDFASFLTFNWRYLQFPWMNFDEKYIFGNVMSWTLHSSLEAILGRTKLSTKTKTGDGWGMVLGVPNNFLWNPIWCFPEQSCQKFCFGTLANFKACFDEYFVVKCRLRVWKLLVAFNDVSKTGLGSKIRTPYAEILAFFGDKVRRD
jgi:hypothetical protein